MNKTIEGIIEKINKMSNDELANLEEKIKNLKETNSKLFIKDINGDFIIPAYQRGYKWTETDVLNLIKDIEEKEDNVNYCLQPLIVAEQKDGKLEVVDGQQRLTTIYLILYCLQAFNEQQKQFNITYETRNTSNNGNANNNATLNDMCNKLTNNSTQEFAQQEYTQNEYFLNNALKTIKTYFDINNFKQKNKNKIDKFLKNLADVFFIFYTLKDENKKDVFSNINVGKIPLTNAELIKALLLSENNLKNHYSNQPANVETVQNLLSNKWNNIEKELQDDDFWYFLAKPDEYKTRIELLFDLCAKEYCETKGKNGEKEFKDLNKNRMDPRWTFYIYSAILKQKNKTIKELWDDVEDKFELLQSAYKNKKLYHLIGYLIAIDVDRKEIIDILKHQDKEKELKEKIKESLGYKQNNANSQKVNSIFYNGNVDVSQLEYNFDKPLIKKTLLLHNVVTVQNQVFDSKFNFNKYKTDSWDVEHINPKSKEEDPNNENINNISNLCLLSSAINRDFDYRDKDFKTKRDFIKGSISKGAYVLICTERVFNKFYNGSNKTMWESDDQNAYIETINKDLNEFFKKEK